MIEELRQPQHQITVVLEEGIIFALQQEPSSLPRPPLTVVAAANGDQKAVRGEGPAPKPRLLRCRVRRQKILGLPYLVLIGAAAAAAAAVGQEAARGTPRRCIAEEQQARHRQGRRRWRG